MNPVGVVIGRFQVPHLTEGHITLLNKANSHKNLLILLAVKDYYPDQSNPLNFLQRKSIIQARYPLATILPLQDCYSDQDWSDQIDLLITSVCRWEKATLYQGRGGSIKQHYKGKHEIEHIKMHPYLESYSGTELRNQVVQGKSQDDFYHGVIKGVHSVGPVTRLTVDVAMIQETVEPYIWLLLLGKKKGQDKWRLPGGFVDHGELPLRAAKRELMEETKLEAGDWTLVDTVYVSDPRAGEGSKVLTFLYKTKYVFGCPKAYDDLQEVEWFKVDLYEQRLRKIIPNTSIYKTIEECIVESHIPLVEKILNVRK